MPADDDRRSTPEVLAAVRALTGRGREVARAGAEVVGAGVDDAVRVLVDRRIERALRPTAPTVSADDVRAALCAPTSSSLARLVGKGGARFASRTRAFRAVGRRHPVGLALRFGPGMVDAIGANLRSLDTAVAHLVTRARARRIEPHPDKLRAVVVQALVGEPVDPHADVDHVGLLGLWLGDVGRRVMPLGVGSINGLVRGRTPDAVVAALAQVDVRDLR